MINPLSSLPVALPFVQVTKPAVKRFSRVAIRWMIRRDHPEVLAIEEGSHKYPWCEEEFLTLLRERSVIGMVAEWGEKVVGFMLYRLETNRLTVLDFAVDPEFRRSGVATQMVAKLVGKLSSHRRVKIALDVRETSLDALLFFRSQGFVATETLREHYEDSGEDAYHLEYLLREDNPGLTMTLYATQDDAELGEGNCPECCP